MNEEKEIYQVGIHDTTSGNEIVQKAKQEITASNNDLLTKVNELQVTNESENTAMVSLLGLIKKGEKAIKAKLAPSKKKAKATYDEIRDLEKSFLSSLEEARAIGNTKSVKWIEEETEKREVLQRKLDAEREAKERAEAERVAKLQAKAEEKGKVSVAVEKVVPQVVVAKVSAPQGVSYVDSWSAEVVDPKALLQSVLDGLNGKTGNHAVPSCVTWNMPTLNSFARMMKCESNIPGVVFKKTRTIRNY